MNKDLLFNLYKVFSPSYEEEKMRKFIKNYIRKNCGSVKITRDSAGNLLCTKGVSDTYPCLASHMDQVQDEHAGDFCVVCNKDVAFGYSPSKHMQQGLGADDKNGIYVCLECLRKYDVLKVAFFVEEEVGCGGSEKVDLEFFKDCRFVIQPDRKGHADLITSMFAGTVCSDDFVKAIGADKFGYEEDHGSITDVGTLVERGVGISCLNLSCGYYEAHTDQEFTVLSELENCLNFVEHIIETCTDVYPFECEFNDFSGYRYGGYGYGGYGYYKHGNTRTFSSAFNKTSVFKPQKKSEVKKQDGYYSGGYYASDCDIMRELVIYDRDMPIESFVSYYKDDFYASMFYEDPKDLEAVLGMIRENVLDEDIRYSHEDFWDDEQLEEELSVEKSVS